MLFNGMYPMNNISSYPMGIAPISYFGGAHPSSIKPSGVNYYAGIQATSPIQPVESVGVKSNQYAPVLNQPVVDSFNPQGSNAQVQNLNAILVSAQNEQGVIGKFWDGIKGAIGIGLSSKKCQKYINKVQSGQMSYQDAYAQISKYGYKQKSAVNMLSGIASGALSAAALGFAPVTGGASILAAAGVGAASKAGLKTLDRATNNVQKDALNAKLIIKDGLSGALNGAVSSVTVGIGSKAVASATTSSEALKQGLIQGAKGGAISGAAMGAGDYAIECAIEQDREFKLDELVHNTAYSAIAGGATGAVIGGVTAHARFNKPSGAKPPVKAETKPAATETKLVSVETKPVTTEAKPITTETKPVTTEAKPITTETKPIVTETKPVSVEAKPITTEAKPVTTEVKPVTVETKPVTVETKPVTVETKPIVTEVKPVTVETKPVVVDTPSSEVISDASIKTNMSDFLVHKKTAVAPSDSATANFKNNVSNVFASLKGFGSKAKSFFSGS